MRKDSRQLRLFDEFEDLGKADSTTTFIDNLALPIHRWFRYTAGFSALWVRDLIEREKSNGKINVLDPFVGSGTVVLEGEFCGVNAIGIEAHPFIFRVAKTKLLWREDPDHFFNFGEAILKKAKHLSPAVCDSPRLVEKCYPPEVLARLRQLEAALELPTSQDGPLHELAWLVLVTILRDCSPVGTAQWQYVLPNRKKARTGDPFESFRAKVALMSQDMRSRQTMPSGPWGEIHREDAQECPSVPDQWADLVITSPPYANNYDYADATRLEMSFFGEVNGWGDLHEAARKYLVRSNTQHVSKLKNTLEEIFSEPLLNPIKKEMTVVCRQLDKEKENHGGRKFYHTMIAAYFCDMAHVLAALRKKTRPGALLCLVIGDSAPYGIYVPVERWLGELALAVGFRSYRFEKIRDRNIKWKNRKHRVPLKEGRLWIEG